MLQRPAVCSELSKVVSLTLHVGQLIPLLLELLLQGLALLLQGGQRLSALQPLAGHLQQQHGGQNKGGQEARGPEPGRLERDK